MPRTPYKPHFRTIKNKAKKDVNFEQVKEDEKSSLPSSIRKKVNAIARCVERSAIALSLITGGMYLADRDKKAENEEKAERKKWEEGMEARSKRIEENQREMSAGGKRLEENQLDLKKSVDGIARTLESGKKKTS